MSVDVSVIIPVFNRAGLARQAIDSVSAGAAGGLELEINVVDDGSVPKEAAAIEKICEGNPACRYFRLDSNQGPQVARNLGLANATGRYIKFLDSDDLLLPDSLIEECALLEAADADILVSGWLRTTMGDSRLTHAQAGKPPPYLGNPYDAVLFSRFGAPISAVLYRRNAIGDIRWDKQIRHPDDWFFLIKVLLGEPRVVVRERPAFVWRDHEGPRQSSTSQINYAHARFHILDYLYQSMRQKAALTDSRKQALANYFYRDIYIAYRHDRAHYQRLLARLDEIDSRYYPSSEVEPHVIMRLCGRLLGYRRYIPLHDMIWRLVDCCSRK